jgi:hypothetical protein
VVLGERWGSESRRHQGRSANHLDTVHFTLSFERTMKGERTFPSSVPLHLNRRITTPRPSSRVRQRRRQPGSDRSSFRCHAEAMSPRRQSLLIEIISPHRTEPLFPLLIDAAQEVNLVHILPHSWERAP